MAIKPPRNIKPNFEFPQVMLAPVAGVTDRANREIARSLGCPLTFSELISARGIKEKNKGSMQMLEECRGEHPLVVQVFGNEIDSMYEAVRFLDDMGVEGINLNLGCPVKKVFKNKSGCGLTVFPTELVYVIRAMRKATDRHLSVKIRAGVNHRSLHYRLIGDIAQGEGCDAIIFHARTRMMGFGGEAQWHWIRDLKEYLDIPVIGNGDVVDAVSAKRMLDQTGCDGVMIARGSYGNPWIFQEILDYLNDGRLLSPPSLQDRLETLLRHLRLAAEWKGEPRGIREMRKQFGWYIKGYRNVRPLREAVNRLDSLKEVTAAINQWAENLSADPYETYEIAAPPSNRAVSLRIG
ncbi:MAG: tRNA dihydrouridine synthase DusB [Candidatus Omnitrophica bacterium]|nr:tRNA dihydrouridine synthase DusB [Candidatus Omnitrophota bacterium]